MNLRLLVLLLVLAPLPGCQSLGSDPYASAPYRLPLGSRLILHTDLQIPGYRLRYPLPPGRGPVGGYDPLCYLLFDHSQAGPRRLAAGAYRLTGLRRVIDWFGAERATGMLRVSETMGGDAAPSPVAFNTIMTLSPPDGGAGSLTLVCQEQQIPTAGFHLTVAEIRQGLGADWTLELVADGGR